MNDRRLSTRALATLSLAALVTWPVLVVLLHLIQRGSYDPASQAVSELALGRAGWLMAVAFPAAGLGVLGFTALIRRTDPGAVAVPVLGVLSAVASVLAAVFRADPENVTTTHGTIHQLLGVVSFLTLVVAMFVCARRFRRVELWRPWAMPSLIWGIAGIAAFMLVPTDLLGAGHFGIAQRIFLAVWLSWPITLTVYARRHAAAAQPKSTSAVATVPAVRPGAR